MSNLFIVHPTTHESYCIHLSAHTHTHAHTMYNVIMPMKRIYAPHTICARSLLARPFYITSFLFGFDFSSIRIKQTTFIAQKRTLQWHMWKFLRVRILFKSSATSKNKLYFNMHCKCVCVYVHVKGASERGKVCQFDEMMCSKWSHELKYCRKANAKTE